MQLRIGLNSGEVITGEIGPGPMTYTAVGEQVGMAQPMESVAPPGGVMVSDSTARLVDGVALLGDTEQVHLKGATDPVPAHRLLGMATNRRSNRAEPTFVGREWELGALNGVLERSMNGRGSVVGLVGPPGIGKSRMLREITSLAKAAGAEVFATYCESHTTDVPFHAATGLLRATTGLDGLADARTTPTVYVIEDAHWIDGISESMLADFLTVIPRTPSLVLVTYRPEYDGALAHAPLSQTIALEPLDESQMLALGAELLGEDRSVSELAELIAERAAGNPFFAEEIVRDLSERDVLVGGRGCYLCTDPIASVHVPSTLQAVIAARIDRLEPGAKRTLNAAAVIGSRFTPDMLRALDVESALSDLVSAELIDQVAFHPQPEYAFRHPLIRAVAYESQLKSARGQLHKRVAIAIEQEDQNAALIAEHLEAAGDLQAAYEWHMRAGTWSINRDHVAAQLSWERALQVADALPADAPGILAMGMAGLVMEHVIRGRMREASQLASENMALVESIGQPAITVALTFASCVAKFQVAELEDVLRWSQAVIDLADGEPTAESIILGSPLAMALALRVSARWSMGLSGWREDLQQAITMSRSSDAVSHSAVAAYTYIAIPRGVLRADDAVLADIDKAMQIAEKSSEDIALVMIRMIMGIALIASDSRDSQRGYDAGRPL